MKTIYKGILALFCAASFVAVSSPAQSYWYRYHYYRPYYRPYHRVHYVPYAKRCIWIRGHRINGYWVPGHWRCRY